MSTATITIPADLATQLIQLNIEERERNWASLVCNRNKTAAERGPSQVEDYLAPITAEGGPTALGAIGLDQLFRMARGQTKLGHDDRWEALGIVANAARTELLIDNGKAPKGECSYCDGLRELGEIHHPRHQPSTRCQSGGRAHCTCDRCW